MDALSDVRKPYARIGTRLEQIACCLDIGFRHMLFALDDVAFLQMHASFGCPQGLYDASFIVFIVNIIANCLTILS